MSINNIYGSGTNKNIHNVKIEPIKNKNSTNSQKSKENSQKDVVSISSEARLLSDGAEQTKEKENYFGEGESVLDMMEAIKKQAMEKDKDSSDILLKCMIIATRIMRGDNVPAKDEKFLAENQPEMYLRAVLLREEKENPKNHESLFKDDDKISIDDLSDSSSISISDEIETSLED